jgi:D-amino-acid dehydrogenase
MSKPESVVVIGGGAAGLWSAWSLAEAGFKVTVLDAAKAGSGASFGNLGWICPAQAGPLPEPGIVVHGFRDMFKRNAALSFTIPAIIRMAPWILGFVLKSNKRDYDRGLRALSELGYPSFELIDRAGLGEYCDKSGVLAIARKRDDVQHFVDKLAPLIELGQAPPGPVLSGDAVQKVDPIAPKGYSGVEVGDHWQIDPPVYNAALIERVKAMGVKIIEDQPVLGFDATKGKVRAAKTAQDTFEADYFVIAAGAKTSSSLSRGLGYPIPVVEGKGYSIDVEPTLMPKQAIYTLDTHLGLSPIGNRMRIAGIMEFSNRTKRVTQSRVEAMKRATREIIGPWKSESPAWVGVRPVAPDGLPLIGRLAPGSNALVATGYAMLGMTISPAAGAALASAIINGDDGSSGPFSPQRFRLRRPKPVKA